MTIENFDVMEFKRTQFERKLKVPLNFENRKVSAHRLLFKQLCEQAKEVTLI